MPHRILLRVSAVQFGWLTFWAVTLALALASERISDTDSMLVIGGVFVAAGLAAAAAYLAASGALARRGKLFNWLALLLISALNALLLVVIVQASAGT